MHYAFLTEREREEAAISRLMGKAYRPSRPTCVSQLDDISSSFANALEALSYGRTLAYLIYKEKVRMTDRVRLTMRRDLPYCYNNTVLCNRAYKPVGCNNEYSNYVNYEEYPHLSTAGWEEIIEPFRRKPDSKFEPCCFEFGDKVLNYVGGKGYFHYDNTAPWNSRKNLKQYIEVLTCVRDALGNARL